MAAMSYLNHGVAVDTGEDDRDNGDKAMTSVELAPSGERLLLRLILGPKKSGLELFRGKVGNGRRFRNDERML